MELYITFIPDESPYHLTLNEIKEEIKKLYEDKTTAFAICREIATREHYHIYINIKHKEYNDKNRNEVRRRLRPFLIGEIRISTRQVEDRIRAIAYTIKDGNYVYHNLDWFDLVKAKEITHKKAKSYDILIKDFYEKVDNKHQTKLIDEVLDIFDKCNIPIDKDRVAKIVRLALYKQKDNIEFKNNLRKDIFDRI